MYHETTGLKILVLHMLSGFEHFEAVSKISLPSPNGILSCTILSMLLYIANCSKSEYYPWLTISYDPVYVAAIGILG